MECLAEGRFLSFASVIASAVACSRVADSSRAGGSRWSSWPGSLRSVRRAGLRRTTAQNHTLHLPFTHIVREAVDLIGQLFALEKQAKDVSVAERQEPAVISVTKNEAIAADQGH
jgi:hypothetical protein